MRLIDADNLFVEKVPITDEAGYTARFPVVMKDTLDAAPTIDAAPVVHAHWELQRAYPTKGIFACSKCCRKITLEAFDKLSNYLYCSHCGAKMDEKPPKEAEP